jgi:hypothetical protein
VLAEVMVPEVDHTIRGHVQVWGSTRINGCYLSSALTGRDFQRMCASTFSVMFLLSSEQVPAS